MGLETSTYIDGLVPANPLGTDVISKGDDHIRLLKSTIKASFPDVDEPVATIHNGGTAPASKQTGSVWRDTGNSVIKMWNGSAWVVLAIDFNISNKVDIDSGTIDGITIGTNAVCQDLRVDNLQVDGNAITSTNSNGDVTITPNGSGNIVLDGQKFPQADGSNTDYLTTNGSGQLAWTTNTVPASEANALASANASASSATASASSATSSANSLSACQTAQTACESVLDTFDDRFLGVKSSAPTLDNDSQSLQDGALYFNTVSNRMFVYDQGNSAWLQLAPSDQDQQNINVVAGNILFKEDCGLITESVTSSSGSDISTVAGSISNVNTVANSTNLSNITSVSGSIANINTTANAISSVTTTAGISTAIGNVSNISSAVSTVSGIASDVSAVSAKATEVGLLGQSSVVTNLGHVGTSQAVSNLNTCATNISDIGVVAGDATEIGVLAGLSSTLTAVNNNSTNINSVNSNSANINVVAGVASGINFFTSRYRIGTSDPTSDNDAGDLFFNTQTGELRAYSNSWQATAPSATNQAHINNVSGALVYEDDNGLITDALNTSSSTGDIATVATNIDAINRLGTVDAISDMNLLGSQAIVDDLNLLASQSVIDDMALLSSQAVIDDMALLSTQAVVDDLAILGSSSVVSNLATVSSNVADVNRYSDEYTISGSAPSSPSAGDLWYDSSANVLKYRTNTTWASLTAGIAEIVQDTTPQLAGALDCQNNNLSNVGTVDGSNLTIDFGTL